MASKRAGRNSSPSVFLWAERALGYAANRQSRVAFVLGFVVGVLGNTFADSSVHTPGDVFTRLFDVSARPIVVVNWVLVLGTCAWILSPRLLRMFTSKRRPERQLRDVFSDARPAILENHAVLAIDGAITLARHPVLEGGGWRLNPSEVHFEFEAVPWSPPPWTDADRRQFVETLHGSTQRDSNLIRLIKNPSVFSDAPQLRLSAEQIKYSEMQYFRRNLLDLATVPARVNEVVDPAGDEPLDIPAGMTAQIVVVTNDGKVLLTQRSMKMFWFPGRWSCSIEENMTVEEDVAEGREHGGNVAAIVALVARGLREELGLRTNADYAPENARVLSVFLETFESILAIHLCVVVRLSITARECDDRIREQPDRADDELRRWIFADAADLIPYLAPSVDNRFHPTSRYRMMMFLLHKWGSETLKRRMENYMADPLADRDPLNLPKPASEQD